MGEFFLQFSLDDARRSIVSPYFGRLIITKMDMRKILDLEYYDRRLSEILCKVYNIVEFKSFQRKINLIKNREDAIMFYEEFLESLRSEDKRLVLDAFEAQDRLEQETINSIKPWDLWLISLSCRSEFLGRTGYLYVDMLRRRL
jgi:hypothetical protein